MGVNIVLYHKDFFLLLFKLAKLNINYTFVISLALTKIHFLIL